MQQKHISSGFTLVELSIVMVIIGLIVALVMNLTGARDNAENQAIIAEMNSYLAAEKTFRQTYGYRAGDHPEPSRFFSGDAATAGDGDGRWDTSTERDALWLQFKAAELTKDALELPSSAADNRIIGTHRPKSSLKNAGWTYMDSYDLDPAGAVSSIIFYNVLRIGGWVTGTIGGTNGGEYLEAGVLDINQHRYIDGKIDIIDTPATGNYFVGEDSTCMTESGGVYSYATTPTLLCTGNFAERSVTP